MALTCSAAALWLPIAASAQQAAPAAIPDGPSQTKSTVEPREGGGGGDIVVTARRVSENLTQVPASISAFSAIQLARTVSSERRTSSSSLRA
jgi:hypothetical protein